MVSVPQASKITIILVVSSPAESIDVSSTVGQNVTNALFLITTQQIMGSSKWLRSLFPASVIAFLGVLSLLGRGRVCFNSDFSCQILGNFFSSSILFASWVIQAVDGFICGVP